MTNKPMLSVELRQALADFIEYSVPGPRSDDAMWYADKQALRALLDRPVNFLTPDCPDCACVQDGQCLCIPSKPAAQHQGGPVGEVVHVSEDRIQIGLYDEYSLEVGDLVYAEQPAPVAVGDDQEFSVCWFEASQQWVVIFPSGKTLTGKFGSMGYAEGAALEYLGLGEADFEVTEDNGSFYRYERDSEAEQ